MTVFIKVHCDGNGCCNEREFYENDPYEEALISAGWTINYEDEFHYCPSCKKKMIENGEYTEGDYE